MSLVGTNAPQFIFLLILFSFNFVFLLVPFVLVYIGDSVIFSANWAHITCPEKAEKHPANRNTITY